MSGGLVRTLASGVQRCLTTDSTANAYTDPVASLAEPVADGVVNVAGVFNQVQADIILQPFGTGAAGTTFNLRVHGWKKGALGLWIPETLLEVTCTLGTKVGVAASDVLDTNKFCDTIALVFGIANVSESVLSPTGNLFATVTFDLKGCRKFQAEIKIGTATNGNALWRGA